MLFKNCFEIVKRAMPDDILRLVKDEIHQKSFTWAKCLHPTSGNKIKTIEKDKEKQNRLNFMEWIVYLTLFAQEINKLQTVSGDEAKTPL